MSNNSEYNNFLSSLSHKIAKPTFNNDSNDGKRFIDKVTTTSNTDVELLITNKDKLELALIKYEKALKDRFAWATPFGIFISLLLTCVTADSFKPFLNLSAEVWKAIVIVSCFGSFIWLIIAIIKMLKSRGEAELDTVINDLMKRNAK